MLDNGLGNRPVEFWFRHCRRVGLRSYLRHFSLPGLLLSYSHLPPALGQHFFGDELSFWRPSWLGQAGPMHRAASFQSWLVRSTWSSSTSTWLVPKSLCGRCTSGRSTPGGSQSLKLMSGLSRGYSRGPAISTRRTESFTGAWGICGFHITSFYRALRNEPLPCLDLEEALVTFMDWLGEVNMFKFWPNCPILYIFRWMVPLSSLPMAASGSRARCCFETWRSSRSRTTRSSLVLPTVSLLQRSWCHRPSATALRGCWGSLGSPGRRWTTQWRKLTTWGESARCQNWTNLVLVVCPAWQRNKTQIQCTIKCVNTNTVYHKMCKHKYSVP